MTMKTSRLRRTVARRECGAAASFPVVPPTLGELSDRGSSLAENGMRPGCVSNLSGPGASHSPARRGSSLAPPEIGGAGV